jgi:hypothetical protein
MGFFLLRTHNCFALHNHTHIHSQTYNKWCESSWAALVQRGKSRSLIRNLSKNYGLKTKKLSGNSADSRIFQLFIAIIAIVSIACEQFCSVFFSEVVANHQSRWTEWHKCFMWRPTAVGRASLRWFSDSVVHTLFDLNIKTHSRT